MKPVTNYCEAILGYDPQAKSSLKLIPGFTGCSDALLDMVFCYSKPVNLSPGETLIQEGLFDQWVYFIIDGDLDVYIKGKKLGSTTGPIVGERCILGEPRGANLLSGKNGLMALGVEMTIVDELFRKVNDFRKTTKNKEEIHKFSEEKLAIALELLTIILSEIISRIINLHQTGLKSFDTLSKSRPAMNIQLQSLYDFSEDHLSKKTNKKNPKSKPAQNIAVYSFDDFSNIVYFDILYKHLSDYGFKKFPQEKWKKIFIVDEKSRVKIEDAYAWLKKDYKLTNADLIDLTYSIFETASKYTAAANNSISEILSISDCKKEQQKIIKEAAPEEKKVTKIVQDELRQKLFDPIEKKLQSKKESDVKSTNGRLNQDEIDAFFS